MPYQVQQMIEGKGTPVCVTKDDKVTTALALMIEHDFSQLPVLDKKDDFHIIKGYIITYEGILRGIRNFNTKIEDFRVRDVMVSASLYDIEDNLFDILDRMKDTNAVLITKRQDGLVLVGIVTSYDTAEYFRSRTEDLMRVEDVELTIKDLIKAIYVDEQGNLDETKLSDAVNKVTAHMVKDGSGKDKVVTFDELTLADYIRLFIRKETWSFLEPVFFLPRESVQELLNGVREIRNALAHFRSDLSAEQRYKLKYAAEWISMRQDEFQALRQSQLRTVTVEPEPAYQAQVSDSVVLIPLSQQSQPAVTEINSTDYTVAEADNAGSRYAALADWLQGQRGRVEQIQLTFKQIEEIIQFELPPSARNHRAFWANDSVGHTQSQLWLDAGWRTTYVNLREEKVTFARIREREQAYIAFFSMLLDELRKKGNFPVRDLSPDGASWIEMLGIPRSGPYLGTFAFSFSRYKGLRVELYLDLGDQAQTKAAFDKLYSQKETLEARLGAIDWERLNDRRASRIAMYHEGQITDEKNLANLRHWAVETMVKFYPALLEPAEQAIREAKQA